MPNSILWIGLVVLWVFVLFPMLTTRHPRIRQHTDAALATRVLHRGGDAQRRTRKGPATGHDTDPDYVPVRRKHHHSDDPEDRMTRSDDSSTAESDEKDFDTARAGATGEASAPPPESPGSDSDSVVDAEIDAELTAETADSDAELGAESDNEDRADREARADHEDREENADREEPAKTTENRDEDAESIVLEEDSHESGSGRRRGRAEARQRARVPALREPEPEDEYDDESGAEDSDFVPTRRGRGGYDPEADAIARAARYTFRQRAVLGLILSTLIFAAAGLAMSATLWWLCALSGTVLVAYLAYLRRQTQLESDIRRRRLARLSRPRTSTEDEEPSRATETPAPDREATRTQLRRAVLVEPDDEDPAFEHLELFDAATARATRQRATGARERRAVGE
ncbi:divisome protein SepX/GlpR [Nocardia inohanensis]|uniref:divisome protein SepX/GlpR n=1 Tax=Nocardia inohanensis TaxID=209246 RepID=UPI00083265E2|nr:gephyrin-like molybdotransferase receptor GlpR [Nocardia inohanensis]